MICFKLTTDEIERIKRAADAVGFPWQPIVERPGTARRFLRRVENELVRNGDRPPSTRPARTGFRQRSLAGA